MSRLLLALTVALSFSFAPPLDQPQLNATPSIVSYGNSCKLTWQSSADAAFLSNFGQVPSSGSLSVTPDDTTDFVLVTESKDGVAFAHVRVEVRGVKGESAYPDIDEFGTGVKGRKVSRGYIDFLVQVMKVLQDRMSFHIRGRICRTIPTM